MWDNKVEISAGSSRMELKWNPPECETYSSGNIREILLHHWFQLIKTFLIMTIPF